MPVRRLRGPGCRRSTLLLSVLAILVATAGAAATPAMAVGGARAAGAVRLARGEIRKLGAVVCGRVASHWQPGVRLGSQTFVSDGRLAAYDARRARQTTGRAQVAYVAAAARMRHRAASDAPVCLHLGDPAGAVRLASSAITHVGSLTCGAVSGQWISGTVLASGYFVSDAQQARNARSLAAHARGRRKAAARRAAAAYARRASAGLVQCASGSHGPGSSFGPTGREPLRFDIARAAGLALRSGASGAARRVANASALTTSASSAHSNLVAISPGGAVSDAVSSGNAVVNRFFIAPDDKLYVLFGSAVGLSPSDPDPCLLAVVDRASGVPTCVDTSLAVIGSAPNMTPIQFDSSGAMYYVGGTTNGGTWFVGKYVNGTVVPLLTLTPPPAGQPNYAFITQFAVSPDGSVLVGYTRADDTAVTQIFTPGGDVKDLTPGFFSFGAFPDGNLYLGGEFVSTLRGGVVRYLTSTGQLDPKPWIDPPGSTATAYNDTSGLCSAWDTWQEKWFCTTNGAWASWTDTTASGKELVTIGTLGPNGCAGFMQYYPTVRYLPTQVAAITAAQAVGDDVALAGTNAAGANVVTLYHTSDDSETGIVGPGSSARSIRISTLAYADGADELMFTGVDSADGQYVVGRLDVGSGAVSILSRAAASWSELQTFH